MPLRSPGFLLLDPLLTSLSLFLLGYLVTYTLISYSKTSFHIYPKNKSLEHHIALLFSCWVMFDSLWHHGLQHARLPCPSPSPRTCSNSCPLNWWCHPTISSSVVPFSSCLQSFLALGSFSMSWLFAADGQSIGASASASVSPMNIQGMNIQEYFFRIDWFDLLEVQASLKSLLQHHSSKASILQCSALFLAQLSHQYMTTGKTIALSIWTFVAK